MRVHAWRGIGSGYNKFAAESFLDEVANGMGKEPLALRLELTKDQPRAQAVIKAAAEMSDFKRKRPGRGMGIAFSDYHGTLSAGVAEVSVDRSTGKIKVHNYWVAVDPGLVIQPDHVHGQLESARRVRAERGATGRADREGRSHPADQLQRLPGLADERSAGHPH